MLNVNINNDAIERHIIATVNRLQIENKWLQDWIKADREVLSCAVCGKPIENVSIQRMLRPFLWCSRECFQLKPRKIIHLERHFNMDIVLVLRQTTKQYGNIKAQCGALGISIPYFYSIIAKYCAGNYVSFMASNASGKRKETYAKKQNKVGPRIFGKARGKKLSRS